MPAVNLNRRDYYVTGVTRWDDGREHRFDDFKAEPIVCPQSTRYEGPGIRVPYTVTIQTCEKLTAAQHDAEDVRTEAHCERILSEME